jgi:hypothetical protein
MCPRPDDREEVSGMDEPKRDDDGPETVEFDVDDWLATIGQDEPIEIHDWPNKRPGAA